MASDHEPAAVAEALRTAGVGDVDDSVLARVTHAQDASLYRVVPDVVAAPRDPDDVVAIVAVARRLGIGVTARGAGTSIAGNAVGPGIVVDYRRHMDRILHLSRDRAVVQPGVVLDDLQAAASPLGVRFGAEPATHSRATLGGMVGNNSCGARALRFGRTSDGVRALGVVTGDGRRTTLGADGDLRAMGDHDVAARDDLVAGLAAIGRTHRAVIRSEFGRIPRQVSGYALEHLAPDDVDGSLPERAAARLVVGSEGTLAQVTAVEVDLVPTPAHTVLVVLGYPDLASAADAAPSLLAREPVAVEGLDARIVDAVRNRAGRVAVPPLPSGAGWLFVELGGADPAALSSTAAAVVAEAGAQDHLVVTDPGHARALWGIREAGAGLAAVAPSGARAHAGWEDSAVAPDRLGDYLRDLEVLLVEHGLTGMPYGHFGDGCLHLRLDFALGTRDGARDFRRFMVEATDLVMSHGGTASGEHGDGRLRGWLLDRQYSPAAITAMAQVKALFDPEGVCNPGVIVDPVPGDLDLRATGAVRVPSSGFAFAADDGDLTAATHRCTGVGACVSTRTGSQVMCPSYVATEQEHDSTRGRARVLQEVLRGDLVPDLADPAVTAALDLCLSCKACASDCPTGVDMARLKSEVLHRRARDGQRPRSHRVLGRLPALADVAAVAPLIANATMALPGLGAVARRAADIDPRRALPAFAETTFRASYARMARAGRVPAPARPVGAVVLWVDTFTDHFAPEAAVATLRVLVAAGFAVEVVTDDACCGLTWITTGQLDAARARLATLVEVLGRAGGGDPTVPVVGVEPPCVAVLRDDLPELLADDPVAAAVSARARTLAEVLATRRPAWTPPSLVGRTVVVQPHCHQYAVMGFGPDRALLAATGAEVVTVGGCCGLAGNWGVERGHHDVSVAIANQQLVPAIDAAPSDAIVVADGFSCRTQVADLAHRRARHLAELLLHGTAL